MMFPVMWQHQASEKGWSVGPGNRNHCRSWSSPFDAFLAASRMQAAMSLCSGRTRGFRRSW